MPLTLQDSLEFPAVGCVSGTFSFDTPNIGTAATVPVGKLPGAAIVTSIIVAVTTAFNGGSTNVINVGTSDSSTRFMATTVASGTLLAQVWSGVASTGLGYVVPAGGKKVYIQYTQTGSAATTGTVRVAISYIPGNPYFHAG